MNVNSSISLCRICLDSGAAIPIFQSDGTINSTIFSKLSLCLNDEVKDIDGYPRNICNLCNITLNNVYNFLRKFRESTLKLETGKALVIKQECEEESFCDIEPKVQIELVDLKSEPYDADNLLEISPPLHLKIKSFTKKKSVVKKSKKTCKTKQQKQSPKPKTYLPKNKTNKIASSILEGDFAWKGEKWCLQSTKTTPENKEVKIDPKDKKSIKSPPLKEKKPPELLLCDLCGNVYDNLDKLKRHRNSAHQENPAKCPTCSKVFRSPYCLKRHVFRKHEEHEKNFVCSSCGKQFAFKAEMAIHFRRVHNKHLVPRKTFACKLCDKSFLCRRSVTMHERAVHTGERPAVCSICGKSFTNEDYLKEHFRLHTGEKPFECPVCGQGYAQRGNMKSHVRHNHRLSQLDPLTLRTLKPNILRFMKP